MNKYWWIKERDNLHKTYYVAYGNSLSVQEARKMNSPLHGTNIMYKYKTEVDYLEAIKRLKSKKCRIIYHAT